MSFENEERFVKTFIRKNRQDRLLFELTRPDRRYDGLDRFCHGTDDLINKSKVIFSGTNLNKDPEFVRFVKKHNEICHLMSPDSNFDDCDMLLSEALSELFYCMDASIILGKNFAIITAEADKKGTMQYVLEDNVNKRKE